MESWRSGIMSEVEIIAVEIDPTSALYYKIHTISILQVRKLVIQVTSTSRKTCTTSYKYKYNLQVAKNRPLGCDFLFFIINKSRQPVSLRYNLFI